MGDVEESPRKEIMVSDKTVIQGEHKTIFGNGGGGGISANFSEHGLAGMVMQQAVPDPELMKFDVAGVDGYVHGEEEVDARRHSGRIIL
jgi:hypothetical protein